MRVTQTEHVLLKKNMCNRNRRRITQTEYPYIKQNTCI